MNFPSRGVLACGATVLIVLGLTACGGGGSAKSKSASDAASGLTISVAGDKVTIKRSATSKDGTAGASGTVSCTDDYQKLVKSTSVPAPTQPWYATTFITWPATSKETTATLSHSLKNTPQLCVAQTGTTSGSAVVYFDPQAKTGVTKARVESQRSQQASQASAALTAASQATLATVSKGAFPNAAAIATAVTGQGIYAKSAANLQAATETGTLYVIGDQTTAKQAVLAVRDTSGVLHTATQGTTGAPKTATVK